MPATRIADAPLRRKELIERRIEWQPIDPLRDAEEGQLLVDLALRHVGNQRSVKRILINDLVPDAIHRAFGKLRDN